MSSGKPFDLTAFGASTQREAAPATGPAGLNWRQLPGKASEAAVSPDGGVWVVAAGASGSDKHLLHYAHGIWQPVPGAVAHIAASGDGSLYATNAAGDIHHYAFEEDLSYRDALTWSWTAIGSGARDLAVDLGGDVLIIKKSALPDGAIWAKTRGGQWIHFPGAAARIASLPNIYYNVYAINSKGRLVESAGIYGQTWSPTFWTSCLGTASEIVPSYDGNHNVVLGTTDVSGSGRALSLFAPSAPSSCARGTYQALSGAAAQISGFGPYLVAVTTSGAIFFASNNPEGSLPGGAVDTALSPSSARITCYVHNSSCDAPALTFGFIGQPTLYAICSSGHGASISNLQVATAASPYRVTPVIDYSPYLAAFDANCTIAGWVGQYSLFASTPVTYTIAVHVIAYPLQVSPSAMDIAPGYTQTLTVSEAHYFGTLSVMSADSSIASVSGGGSKFVVKGLKIGSTTIAVGDMLGHSATVEVNVSNPIKM